MYINYIWCCENMLPIIGFCKVQAERSLQCYSAVGWYFHLYVFVCVCVCLNMCIPNTVSTKWLWNILWGWCKCRSTLMLTGWLSSRGCTVVDWGNNINLSIPQQLGVGTRIGHHSYLLCTYILQHFRILFVEEHKTYFNFIDEKSGKYWSIHFANIIRNGMILVC